MTSPIVIHSHNKKGAGRTRLQARPSRYGDTSGILNSRQSLKVSADLIRPRVKSLQEAMRGLSKRFRVSPCVAGFHDQQPNRRRKAACVEKLSIRSAMS